MIISVYAPRSGDHVKCHPFFFSKDLYGLVGEGRSRKANIFIVAGDFKVQLGGEEMHEDRVGPHTSTKVSADEQITFNKVWEADLGEMFRAVLSSRLTGLPRSQAYTYASL